MFVVCFTGYFYFIMREEEIYLQISVKKIIYDNVVNEFFSNFDKSRKKFVV